METAMPNIRTAVVILAFAAASTVATASSASPNDHRFAKSSEGMKMAQANVCQLMKDYLDIAEREADKRAGTKAAEPYAKEADQWWAAGERNGCSWAQ
jgi:hypothetical protein